MRSSERVGGMRLRAEARLTIHRGRERWLASPSLRTGRADFPHPALQLVVSTRPDEQLMSLGHGVETQLPEVGIAPSVMIAAAAAASESHSVSKNAAKASSYPRIQQPEQIPGAVFEVLEPAAKDWIEGLNDPSEAIAVVAPCVFADRVLELSQTLLARGSSPLLEVIPQKVKAARCRCIDQLRFLGM